MPVRLVQCRYRIYIFVIALEALIACRGHVVAQDGPAHRKSEVVRTFPLSKFYDTNPMPRGKPGDLIRSEPFEEYELPSEVSAIRILYHSRAATGEDVAASGIVLFPDKKPPDGVWPVIAWAHEMSGVARTCAPSLTRNLQHRPLLAMYVNLGYAVVATDYTGLGTNFRNAFADLPSNAADVINSIPAARAAVPALDSRWVVMGIGEGGLASVAVAEVENQIRDPNFLGSITLSGLSELPDVLEKSPRDWPLLLAYGIKTVLPQFEVSEILTDKAIPAYRSLEHSCTVTSKQSQVSADALLRPNWEKNHFVQSYFDRSRLGDRPAFAPLFVISRESVENPAAQIITRFCKQGDRVQFETYPDPDPGKVIGDSARDQISWIEGRFAGRLAPSNCLGRY